MPETQFPHIDHSILQIKREASLLYCLPDNPFFGIRHLTDVAPSLSTESLQGGGHAVQEATYACKWHDWILINDSRWWGIVRRGMGLRTALLQSTWAFICHPEGSLSRSCLRKVFWHLTCLRISLTSLILPKRRLSMPSRHAFDKKHLLARALWKWLSPTHSWWEL